MLCLWRACGGQFPPHQAILGWQDRVMSADPLLVRARGRWETLAAVPVSFAPSGGLTVVTSPGSGLCLPSWVGLVVLGDAAIATVPTEDAARVLRRVLAAVPVGSLTQSAGIQVVTPVAETLGPAASAYASRDGFRPSPAHAGCGYSCADGVCGETLKRDRRSFASTGSSSAPHAPRPRPAWSAPSPCSAAHSSSIRCRSRGGPLRTSTASGVRLHSLRSCPSCPPRSVSRAASPCGPGPVSRSGRVC